MRSIVNSSRRRSLALITGILLGLLVWRGPSPGSITRPLEAFLDSSTASIPMLRGIRPRAREIWRYVDRAFPETPPVAQFVYPPAGAVAIDPARPFEWTAPPNARAFVLLIGSTWGSADLLKTGELRGRSFQPPALPADRVLYARIVTKTTGTPGTPGGSGYRDTVFSLAPASVVAPTTSLFPADGSVNADAGMPFRWRKVDLATAYRLQIGRAPAGHELHDSGEVFVTRRFVTGLPLGVPLFGRLQTQVGGAWVSTDFTFSAASDAPSPGAIVDSARWATTEVRSMADADNQARPLTPLEVSLLSAQADVALCGDYVRVLLRALRQIDPGRPARALQLAFIPGTLATHVLAEFQRPDTGTWMLLDPTFALTVARARDSMPATAEEIRIATLTQRWGDLSYQFLSEAGDAYARAYYVDYPLLYLNIAHTALPYTAPPPSLAAFLEEVAMPVAGRVKGVYVMECPKGSALTAIIDGRRSTVPCTGPGFMSGAFRATSISVPDGADGAGARAFAVRRSVF